MRRIFRSCTRIRIIPRGYNFLASSATRLCDARFTAAESLSAASACSKDRARARARTTERCLFYLEVLLYKYLFHHFLNYAAKRNELSRAGDVFSRAGASPLRFSFPQVRKPHRNDLGGKNHRCALVVIVVAYIGIVNVPVALPRYFFFADANACDCGTDNL